jgi:hypothetical protein
MAEQIQAVFREFQNIGMNRNVSPFLRIPGQWKYIINGEMENVGVIAKRKGYTVAMDAPSAHEVLSLIPFMVGTVKRLIMINANGSLYSADLSSSSWGAAILTGLSTTARWGWTVMSDASGTKYMILGNGFSVYKTTDGVTFTAVSGAPLGKYWATLYQRVYCAGVPADQDLLHWSSIADLTDWSASAPSDSSTTPIDRFSRGVIKGIVSANDRIVIYKERAMKKWDGEYLLTPQASDGLSAPYSLSEVAGMVFSLGTESLYLYDGAIPQEISLPINDIAKNIDRGTTNIERICGQGFKGKYYLSVGNVTDDDGYTITNCWIVYDLFKDAFYLFSLGVQATSMCRFINGNDGAQDLYFGDSTGTVFKMFQGDQDNGSDMEMHFRSHKVYPGGPESSKQPEFFTLISDPADGMIVTLIADETRQENVAVSNKHVSTAMMPSSLGENNSCFELDITHVGRGRPRVYGWALTIGSLGDERV